MLKSLFSIYSCSNSDWAYDGELNFQDMATAIGYAMEALHSFLMHLLIFISLFVIVLLYFSASLGELLKYTVYVFSGTINSSGSMEQLGSSNTAFNNGFQKLVLFFSTLQHGKTIETVGTTIPCAILAAIALPSYDVAYCAEGILSPELRVHIIANQGYGQYEYFFTYDTGSIYLDSKSEKSNGPIAEGWFYQSYPFESGNAISDDNMEKSFVQTKLTLDSYMIDTNELSPLELRLLQTTQPVVLPINTKIGLSITSNDVLHSFAVPSFGIKVDAIPGRINYVNLFLDREAHAFGQCSEICGVNHGFMPIEIYAIRPHKFFQGANSFPVDKYETIQTLLD